MTSGAADAGVDVPFILDGQADGLRVDAVEVFSLWVGSLERMVGYPGQISDFTHGAEGILRFTVTLKAERHAEGLVVMNFDHLVDATMALNATDASVYVNGMIEINIVRCLVDSNPRYGSSGI